MHPQQKHARFNLIVALSAAIPSVLGFAVLFPLYGPRRAMAAFGFLGILGLWGFGGRFYRKSKEAPTVTMDERDEDIKRRALVIAWAVQWLFLGLLCMGPWFVIVLRDGLEQMEGTLVAYLPFIYMAVAVVHQAAWSIAVLVLYRKGADDVEA